MVTSVGEASRATTAWPRRARSRATRPSPQPPPRGRRPGGRGGRGGPPRGPRRGQVAGDPALAAADLEGQAARGRHDGVEEQVTEQPVGVVAGGGGPAGPRAGL